MSHLSRSDRLPTAVPAAANCCWPAPPPCHIVE